MFFVEFPAASCCFWWLRSCHRSARSLRSLAALALVFCSFLSPQNSIRINDFPLFLLVFGIFLDGQKTSKSMPKTFRKIYLTPPKSVPKPSQNRPQYAPKSRSGGGCDLSCVFVGFWAPHGGVPGPSWGVLGPSWGRLGAVWERPGSVLAASSGVWELSWGVLGASWGRLGAHFIANST